MEDKPAFTPWQVNVSEALRDGDAAAAIEAWHERGRFHLGYNEESEHSRPWWTSGTATRDSTQRNPAVVLARTRAEVRGAVAL